MGERGASFADEVAEMIYDKDRRPPPGVSTPLGRQVGSHGAVGSSGSWSAERSTGLIAAWTLRVG